MDIIKMFWNENFPNLGYVIECDDGTRKIVILGGQPVPKGDDLTVKEPISSRNTKMKKIYFKDSLTEDDERYLAKLLHNMKALCSFRFEGLYDKKEQSAFVDSLSSNEKMQLEEQIQMYKDCRQFYRKHIFR